MTALDLKDAESFPSRRDEDWKYTDVRRHLRAAPEPSPAVGVHGAGPFFELGGEGLTFVNGAPVGADHFTAFGDQVVRLRFVSDAPSDTLVNAMADAYLANDTQIVPMLRTMFASEALRTGLLLRDGALPDELTPPDWPARRLVALVDEAEQRLGGAAVAYVQERIAAGPHAGLVEADLSWPN